MEGEPTTNRNQERESYSGERRSFESGKKPSQAEGAHKKGGKDRGVGQGLPRGVPRQSSGGRESGKIGRRGGSVSF